MGGFFGAVSANDCILDVFYGTDYHSHLGTRRGGMTSYSAELGFQRNIHSIENSPFRTKFEKDVEKMRGNICIGCISDTDPQPIMVRSKLGLYAVCSIGIIQNAKALSEELLESGCANFETMSSGNINSGGLIGALIAQKSSFVEGIRYAQEKGLIVMADVKRNDIGATAACYANAYIGKTDMPDGAQKAFGADIATINPYLGVDGVKPFADACRDNGTGVFVLVKTSNPSSGQLQDLRFEDGRTLYQAVADLVEEWGEETRGESGYSAVGAVVGATYPQQGVELRARMPHAFFLVPGYGAQGAKGTDIAGCFDANGNGAIVNASRSILCAWKKREGMAFDAAARDEALRMKEDLCSSLKAVGKEIK